MSAHTNQTIAQGSSSIKIFPNPTNGYIQLSGIDGKVNVRIFDLLGKELMSKQVYSNKALDLSQLDEGMYLIEVRDNSKCFIERLIKE